MTEDETTGAALEVEEELEPEVEAEAEVIYTEDEPEVDDDALDDEWDDEDEEDTEYVSGFDVRVFFHTGAALTVNVPWESNVVDLRKLLEKQFNRLTYGSPCIVNGRTVGTDYESEYVIEPGAIVTFSGSVKGG